MMKFFFQAHENFNETIEVLKISYKKKRERIFENFFIRFFSLKKKFSPLFSRLIFADHKDRAQFNQDSYSSEIKAILCQHTFSLKINSMMRCNLPA